MKRGMIKAEKKAKKGGSNAKTLLKVVGVGLAAGAALIAATDKTMKTFFPQEEKGECCCGGDCDCDGDCTCGEGECTCGCDAPEEEYNL